MAQSTIELMRELRIWLRDSDYRALKAHAERIAISQSEAVRQAVAKYLGEDAAGQSAPWLSDMIDAVLAKYFVGFPQVLDRLIEKAYALESWDRTALLKLIELTGDKDPRSQDTRVAKTADQITAYARRQADDFFQRLGQPEELIEPPAPGDA